MIPIYTPQNDKYFIELEKRKKERKKIERKTKLKLAKEILEPLFPSIVPTDKLIKKD